MQRLHLVLIPMFAGALLSACVVHPYERRGSSRSPEQPSASSNVPGVQTQAAPTEESTAPAEPLPTPPRPRSLNPASKALVAQAQTQMKAGNNSLAAATIERALRIEPDSPLLWLELAKIRQSEGNAVQAEYLARKALTMATGDAKTQAAAWRAIAQSYRVRDRNLEARDADARAEALGG